MPHRAVESGQLLRHLLLIGLALRGCHLLRAVLSYPARCRVDATAPIAAPFPASPAIAPPAAPFST
jgi:hypothetical protein